MARFRAIDGIGDLRHKTGRPKEAESEYRAAAAIREKLAAENPAVSGFRNQLANSHNNLGWLLAQTGRAQDYGH